MTAEYYEDVELHQKDRSKPYLLREEEIIDFAKQWTPQPFHIDPEYAKKTRIGGLFASGSHLFAVCSKLTVERNARPATIAGLSVDELRFLAPGWPGDLLVLEREAISKRDSGSDPNAGIVLFSFRLLNQMEDLGHPVKLTHCTGHAHVLNSRALDRVGIAMETSDPSGELADLVVLNGDICINPHLLVPLPLHKW